METIIIGILARIFGKPVAMRIGRYVYVFLFVLLLTGVLVTVIKVASWFMPKPTIDEEQIQRIQSQIREERYKALAEELVKTDEILGNVEERNKLTEVEIEEREKVITGRILEADKRIQKAKESGQGDVSAAELEKILEETKEP